MGEFPTKILLDESFLFDGEGAVTSLDMRFPSPQTESQEQ